jgi:hypothetical protein
MAIDQVDAFTLSQGVVSYHFFENPAERCRLCIASDAGNLFIYHCEPPDPDELELKIEDCKLNICGCRFAPFFLKWKEFLKY